MSQVFALALFVQFGFVALMSPLVGSLSFGVQGARDHYQEDTAWLERYGPQPPLWDGSHCCFCFYLKLLSSRQIFFRCFAAGTFGQICDASFCSYLIPFIRFVLFMDDVGR